LFDPGNDEFTGIEFIGENGGGPGGARASPLPSQRLHELCKGRVCTTAYQSFISSNEW